MVDPQIASALQPYLAPRERLTWTGRPARGLMLGPRDALLIPFSLLWGGFAVFWETMVLRTPAPGFFAIWGVPFVLVGLYMIVGRFFHDAWLRSRTVYGVTNERAIILRRAMGANVVSNGLGGEVRITGQRGSSGTLEFGSPPPTLAAMNGFSVWVPSLGGQVRFLQVPNVMEVYQLSLGNREA